MLRSFGSNERWGEGCRSDAAVAASEAGGRSDGRLHQILPALDAAGVTCTIYVSDLLDSTYAP